MDIQGSIEENGRKMDIAQEEINNTFALCPLLCSEYLGPKYILDLAVTSDSNPYVAAALSDFSCDILQIADTRLAKITTFKEHTDKLAACKFSSVDNNLLYTASGDGTIKLWDMRDFKRSVHTFKDTTGGETKCIASFDVSPCNRLLAAGTDLIVSDAFILFWDVRNIKLLGAYWESHTDDITQVKFHPKNTNQLISGSTDGLINVYNLSKSSEEEALEYCLNTEAFIEHVQWFSEKNSYRWNIGCLTSMNDYQLWDINDSAPYKCFKKEDFAIQIKEEIEETYITRPLQMENCQLVLFGLNRGKESELLSVQISNGNLMPAFQFSENRQRIRSSCLNQCTGLLLTGGEEGKLDIWKPLFDEVNGK